MNPRVAASVNGYYVKSDLKGPGMSRTKRPPDPAISPPFPDAPVPDDRMTAAPSPSSPPSLDRGGSCAPGRVREGGGRPPRRAESVVEELVLVPAQFFMISGLEDGRVREMITERIAFHSAVLPFLSLPDMSTH